MKRKIRLTIQEIVDDFECLVRYDEKLDAMFSLQKCNDEEISRFLECTENLADKYVPDYEEKFEIGDAEGYDRALLIYGKLYENFKEIFYQLV